MRAIWKGAVSFGLVSIAVKLYAATEEKNIRFNQVHREDGGRIKYQRVCSIDGEEVAYDDIAKGYDLGGGQMVILTDEDFADLPLSSSRAIDVLEFVPADQVDPILFAKAYYLEPEGQATKPYVLLRDALVESDRVAIVKVALRQREQLATLRVRDGVMVMNTMLWPDEVRAAEFDFLDDDIKVRPAELSMASSLIESMTGEFDPEDFTDDYREALQRVIDAKVSGEEITEPEPEHVKPTAAIDLMAALKASVDRAKAARGERGGPVKPSAPTPITAAKSAKKAAAARDDDEAPAKSTRAKSTTTKRATPAKKAAPAKSAAKKAAPAKKTAAAKKTTSTKSTAKKAPARKAG
jgi:DNA end-binding protein Ku